jgi:hypothetical protein
VTDMPRVFKIGSTRIVADDSLRQMDNEAVRERLKSSFPEVALATIREREENGTLFVEFLPKPGRKG